MADNRSQHPKTIKDLEYLVLSDRFDRWIDPRCLALSSPIEMQREQNCRSRSVLQLDSDIDLYTDDKLIAEYICGFISQNPQRVRDEVAIEILDVLYWVTLEFCSTYVISLCDNLFIGVLSETDAAKLLHKARSMTICHDPIVEQSWKGLLLGLESKLNV